MGLRRFWRDERGTSFEGIALSVSIIAVAFVASADMLDYMTKTRGPALKSEFAALTHPAPPILATATPTVVTAKGGLDETPTASLPKLISRSVLDPCTGASR